eukprot:13268235-Ditylum_brightwellii.AAC.1
MLQKCDAILSTVKAHVVNTQIKYGTKVTRSVKEVKDFDCKNGNTFWQDAIDLEINTIFPGINLVDGNKLPEFYTRTSDHIISDVKMDFTRKVCFVNNGHLERDPVDFTFAALTGLDICAADIKSTYLQAPNSKKEYLICGDKFLLKLQRRIAIIKCALYGGKTAGSDYWKH